MSDKEILEIFQSNPQEGFSLLVKNYQERIYWQIRRIIKTHEGSEDVLQNTFLKIWKGLKNFRGDANLYTWMYRIAFNESQTYLTKNNKVTLVEYDPPLFEKFHTTSGKEYSGEEIEQLLTKALNELPEKQRIVFELKYFEELKFKEISKITETSEGALKASYHLAVKKIMSFFENI